MHIGYIRTASKQEEQLAKIQKDKLVVAGVAEHHIVYETGEPNDKNREFVKMFHSLQKGDVLVVWKLDRIGGSVASLVKFVRGLIKEEIGFKSLTEQIDTTTVQEKTVIEFFELLTNYEHSLASERIKIGLEKARNKGKKSGRPRTITKEKEAKIMEMIKAGVPKTSICRDLNIPRSTIYDMLRRQK